MADTTPIYDLPYLELGDPPDLAAGTEDLATAVEAELIRVDAATAAITGLTPAIGAENTAQASYSSTTFSAGTQQCTAAFNAPPSGVVIVHWKAYFQAGISDKMAFVGCEIRTGSTPGGGSVTTAANSTDAIAAGGTVTSGVPVRLKASTYKLITGLTAGNAYHARVMYQTETSGNITVFTREVMVVPHV
jgi:hypothetical protein